MPFSLKDNVRNDLDQWFHIGEGDFANAEVIREAGFEEKPNDAHVGSVVFSLKLKYLSQSATRQQATTAARKVISRKGSKANVAEEQWSQVLTRKQVYTWAGIGINALIMLRGEFDYSKLADKEVIPFTAENLRALAEHSVLPNLVTEILSDHELWFGETESEIEQNSVKNSQTGQNSNTDE